ncbi:MAG: T9SS type A sorting domain-containing protein [Ignavibacteriae bacterium]|nr:T9SS type A sorting domain-containing protein [Ignavibacteriota bacterium]
MESNFKSFQINRFRILFQRSFLLFIEVNQELRFTTQAGESVNNSYKWFKNGVEIPSVTSKEYIIASAAKADEGVYTYQATNSSVNNLTLYSRPVSVIVHEEVKGVDEEINSTAFALQPNPASSSISIHIRESARVFSSLEIYDILGNVVRKIEANSFEHSYTVGVSDLESGVYTVRVNVEGKSVIQQFVVVR